MQLMSATSNEVQLELTDGTACSVVFAPGDGVKIFRQGQACGVIGENEVGQFAARRHGAMELAAEVEGVLGQQALTTASQDALMDAAYRWFEQNF
jgi:hypothetical protein